MTEAYAKGLDKSAFTPAIYGGLPPEFYVPGTDMVTRLARLQGVAPKFYQSRDVYLAFYRPAEAAASALKQENKAAPAWLSFMRALLRSEHYLKANRITKGSMELAAAAAARLLTTLAGQKTYQLMDKNYDELRKEAQNAGGVEKFLQKLEAEIGEAVASQLEQILKELMEYVEARREAQTAAAQLAGGHSYNLEGLSIWTFLQNPDEFRRRVRLLSAAALALRQFSRILPASLSHQQTESRWGGIDGITQMQTYSQLPDVLPSELALMHASPTLFTLKLVQMSLNVHRRAASIKPIVFVDKSGSMDEPLERGPQQMAKLSIAAGLALALYRKFNADIYLFDTETEMVTPKEVVKVLLSVRADGGTSIDSVIEEITRIGRRDHIYLIISDGITEASEEVLSRFIAKGLAKQTRVILIPPSEEYGWLEAVRRYGGRVINAKDVAGFVAAARKALS